MLRIYTKMSKKSKCVWGEILDSSLCGRVPAEKLGHGKTKFDIILYTRDLKPFQVHEPPIGGAKSALTAHRHFPRLPNNRPQV